MTRTTKIALALSLFAATVLTVGLINSAAAETPAPARSNARSDTALYVQDYGAPIGFRLAVDHPERITAIVVQNGNAHDEGLDNDLWKPIKEYWKARRWTTTWSTLATSPWKRTATPSRS